MDTGRIGAEHAERLARRLDCHRGLRAGHSAAALTRADDGERADLLDRWNATQARPGRGLTMHRAFEAQVARTPDATALVFEDRSL